MLAITSVYAALLTLLFLALSARVITYRRSRQLGLGDEGDRDLLRRMRAQANCAEYAPLGVVLLALVELQGTAVWGVHALGGMLTVGRLAHGWGFSRRPMIMPLRVGGMALTLTMLALSALVLLVGGLL